MIFPTIASIKKKKGKKPGYISFAKFQCKVSVQIQTTERILWQIIPSQQGPYAHKLWLQKKMKSIIKKKKSPLLGNLRKNPRTHFKSSGDCRLLNFTNE